jgi:hypothetical protein
VIFYLLAKLALRRIGLFDYGIIYIGHSTGTLRTKIGYTGRSSKRDRQREIDKSVPGSWEFLPFWVHSFSASLGEKYLHRVFRQWRRPWKGSGGSEWFSLGPINYLRLLFLMLLFWALSDTLLILPAYMLSVEILSRIGFF